MKKVLCFTIALMIVSMPLALATVVFSPQNQDITDVEIVDIITEPEQDNPEKDPPAPPVVEIVEPPKDIETVIEDLKTTYEVTINYVSIDGTEVQEPVKEIVEAGQPINITAVPIENFISAGAEQQIMPARDVELTVIYVPDDFAEKIISIIGYETPLGLGSTFMNVGVCVE